MTDLSESLTRRVLAVIVKTGSMTVLDLMRAMDLDEKTGRTALHGLRKTGSIAGAGRQGYYTIYELTPLGRVRVEKYKRQAREQYDQPIARTWDLPDVVGRVPNSVFQLGACS